MEKFIVTPKEDKSVTMTIRIDRALQEEYNDLAAKTNRSRNELISMALQYALVFLKSVERGKCFIEYIPAECAWNPIEAPGYMYINCLWVSGSFKGHGYSSDLLSECIEDSKEKGKEGLCNSCGSKEKAISG